MYIKEIKIPYFAKRVEILKHANAHAFKPVIPFFSFISFSVVMLFCSMCAINIALAQSHTHIHIYIERDIYYGNHNVKMKSVRNGRKPQ